MFLNVKYLFIFGLLVLPAVLFTFENGNKFSCFAQEAPDQDEEADVESENESEDLAGTGADNENEDDDEDQTTTSPYADTNLLFVKPLSVGGSQMELPAGIPVEFLVGFHNTGEEDFVVESLRASFRYPMDFNFYIQNFSAIGYEKTVQPAHEATFAYSFIPAEAFAGRPFGLNINLAYRDASGNLFQEAVYNETVQIVELEEGLDGETFFLYVFLAAGVVLLLVIGQQTLLSVGKKRTSHKKAPVETGTSNPNNVDMDWIPSQTLQSFYKDKSQLSPKQQKSPRQTKSKSPKINSQSPRQRKVKRTTGSE